VSSEYLITLRLGAPDRFPFTPPRRRGAPPLHLDCWREALVAVGAHEAWHIQQYRRDLPRSEVACERFEAVVLERYREATRLLRTPARPVAGRRRART
jgi:hypothetical protein